MKNLPLVLLLAACSSVTAADWPQWRHDAKRSAATTDELPQALKQQWSFSMGKPAPAYVHQYRMCADYSYAPVAGEGLLFVPSNVTDQVMAVDLETGALKWIYGTDGPVRFAPVYEDGRLYFTSDDGYLYCVEVQSGELIWRARGAPESHPDMRMLVDGRMVSRWPSRGAPVLHEGVVYFGSGIWPEEGSYENAVDAKTGELLWQSDSLSILKEGMCDHGKNYDLSLPPHGYPAVINDKLIATSGRTLAAWFNTADGVLDPYTSFYVKKTNPRGTWYVAGNDDYWVQGGNWFATHANAVSERPKGSSSPLSFSKKSPATAEFALENRPFLTADVNDEIKGEIYYSEPIVTEDVAYVSLFKSVDEHRVLNGDTFVRGKTFDRIVARDLKNPSWVMSASPKQKGVSLIEFPVLWEVKTSMQALVKTGSHIVAGEAGRIAAIALPQGGQPAEVVWEAEIEGLPINTLVADGKIVTMTDTGRIYCFGDGAPSLASIPYQKTLETSPANGFALAMGWGDGGDVLRLAEDPEWRVIVLEQPEKVDECRITLIERGLNGRRVQVIPYRQNMMLTPYWASQVIMNDPTLCGGAETTLSVALDAMRPFSGEMALSNVNEGLLKKLVAGKIDYMIADDVVARISAPEGAADWSQESADGNNSFISQDLLVRWPLGVLWYSGDVDRYLTPDTDLTHIRTPYPLVKDGRMFVFTHNNLHVLDVYTGNYIRKVVLPETAYLNTRHYLNRLYGKPTDRSYVLTDDRVYCVTGDKILSYDVATGEQQQTLMIPEELRVEAEAAASERVEKKMRDYDRRMVMQPHPEWTEVRLWNDSILAKLGNTLVSINRHTGKMQWSRKGTKEYIVTTVGGDTLYALDCVPDDYKRPEKQHGKVGELFALNIADGRELWSREVNYLSWPKVTSKGTFAWMKPVMPTLGFNDTHQLIVMAYNGMSTIVFNGSDGSELWSKEVPDVQQPSLNFSPNILEDHIMMNITKYQGGMGFLVDILTGEKVSDEYQVPTARTCGRLIGNDNLLTYRDGAVELYDIKNDRTIPFNSMRAGCTTSLIPANGVMSAPQLGHGCVCSYPMSASLALYHLPGTDELRPDAVKASWGADKKAQALQPKKKPKK